MASQSRFINNTRAAVDQFLSAYEDLNARVDEYNAQGGEAFVSPFWLDDNGEQRTDLDINFAEFIAVITSVQAISALLAQGHATNLYRGKP